MKMLNADSSEKVGPAVIRHTWVIKILLVCGILSALIWMGADLVASLLFEGYNFPFQPISGLSAVDSPVRSLVIPLIYIYVVLKMAFAVGVWKLAGQMRSLQIAAGALFAWGLIDLAAYFFPWDPNQDLLMLTNILHGILAGGLALILMLLTILYGANANGKGFRYYSYGTLLVFLIAGAVMGFLGNPGMEGNQIPWWFGLTERINTYGFMLWMLTFAILLLRTKFTSSNLAGRKSSIHPGRDAN